LLHLELLRPIPEPEVRNIKIERGGASKAKTKTIDLNPQD
jgi:hypothetical protein